MGQGDEILLFVSRGASMKGCTPFKRMWAGALKRVVGGYGADFHDVVRSPRVTIWIQSERLPRLTHGQLTWLLCYFSVACTLFREGPGIDVRMPVPPLGITVGEFRDAPDATICKLS